MAARVPLGLHGWDAVQLSLAAALFLMVWRFQSLFPSLAFYGLTFAATPVALFVFWLDRDPRRRLSNLNQPVVRAALGILVLVVLSIPTSLVPPRRSLEFLLAHLLTVALMLLVAASVRGLVDLRRLVWLQVAGVTIFSAVVVARSPMGSEGRLLITASYADPNDLSLLIVSILPLTVYLWRPAGLLTRSLLAACAAFLMMTLGNTGSRGGFLGLLAVAAYLLLGFRGISRAKRVSAAALLAILLVVLASDRYFARMQTMLHPSTDYNWSGRSEDGRLEVWTRGIGYMLDHPVFGVGAGAFTTADGALATQFAVRRQHGGRFKSSAPHNSLLQIGAEIGVLGLILFVALLIGAFRALSRIRRGPAGEAAFLAQALIGSLVGFVVAAFFLSHAYSPFLYVLLGMSVGLAKIASPPRAPRLVARPPRPRLVSPPPPRMGSPGAFRN
ncbi:MAG: hypothetical protein AUH78_05230 [Gemmatimonadetes bacterium 13_1_40CM_4_69_8]|nr:MAG: hypothetical protein AUH78_05230 [Gemmatimonadetes bacterium 13_1_40CM_4_69_8]